ncbi:MAG TPA: hypothetical protein VIR05_03090 [Luteimonas sp.]
MAPRRRRDTRKGLAAGPACLGHRPGLLLTATVLACLSAPLHAQSRPFSGEVALSSQLVDRGLAISPATPILQGSASWMSPGGWSMGLAGGVELRSPGQPVVVLGRVSRFWSLSDDWLAHASLLYYDYRAERYRGIPDRAEANLYFTYRDTLSVGVSAMRPSGDQARRLLGAADVEVSYPLARHLSLTAGAGIAQASAGPYRYGGYRYGPKNARDRVQLYGYGSLGLAWSDGALRLQLDRNMNSLGDRRLYGTQAPSDWSATVSWSF